MMIQRLACAAVVVLASCATTTDLSRLKERAKFDLSCSENRLFIQKVDDETYGVYGCDQKAVYVWHCQDPNNIANRECKWLRN